MARSSADLSSDDSSSSGRPAKQSLASQSASPSPSPSRSRSQSLSLSRSHSQTGSPSQSQDVGANQSQTQNEGLSVFCREVRNLLRSKPRCSVAFSKFVPAYHNHYGRQCCVYQFGFTKLIDLLESIPNIVKIDGEGSNRTITLTRREQIKRFASDLIKVVKSQPGKKLKLSQFAKAYEAVLGRQFWLQDYGASDINELLAEIWEGTVNIMPIRRSLCDRSVTTPLFVAPGSSGPTPGEQPAACSSPYITEQHPDCWFEVPKRERSDKEVRRTRFFVRDVIELLSQMRPDCSLPFSKFIPSYHYYFNRQCKVSVFGFSKLIDLFESISPQVVEIVDLGPSEEKLIRLAPGQLRNRIRTRHRSSSNRLRAKGRRASHAHAHSHALQSGRAHNHGHAHSLNLSDVSLSARLSRTRSATPANHNRSLAGLNHNHNINHKLPQQAAAARILHNNRSSSCSPSTSERDSDQTNQADARDLHLHSDDDDDDEQHDDDDDETGDDMILPVSASAIDVGPSEQELLELEEELKAYEQLRLIQSKRSSRMAAILDIFKYS